MNKLFLIFWMVCFGRAVAQPAVSGPVMDGHRPYTVANTHSHNDYEQATPFWLAYNEKFGSMEADVFLQEGELLVGHNLNEIKSHRTLEDLYIKPLLFCVQKNKGYAYADTTRRLQMLIEMKTDSIVELDQLIAVLRKYPLLTDNPSIKWVITGHVPAPSLLASYPPFLFFDGEIFGDYDPAALAKVGMMSADFKKYSHWNGLGDMPADEFGKLQEAVTRSHRLGKPVRFWNAPDFIPAWQQLMRLQVDFINTDHIRQLADFLRNLPATE